MIDYRKLTAEEIKMVESYLAKFGFECWVCGKGWTGGRTLFSGPKVIEERGHGSLILASRLVDGRFRLAYYETRFSRRKIKGIIVRRRRLQEMALVALETVDIAA